MITKTNYSVSLNEINLALKNMPENDYKLVLNKPTGNFFYDSWELKDEFRGTIWETLLSSIKEPVGEARIIKLNPGSCYFSHADIDNRWHLSLSGNQSFLIDLENQKMHKLFSDGVWYIMDAGRCHTAANFGQVHRNQLVVRNLLKRNILKKSVTVEIIQDKISYDFRYVFDNEISPWLNRLNISGKISNFNNCQQSVRFDVEEDLIEELKSLSNNFKIIRF